MCSFIANSAFAQNLIKNPGFETGIISPPWNIWTSNESPSDFGATKSPHRDNGPFHCGLLFLSTPPLSLEMMAQWADR